MFWGIAGFDGARERPDLMSRSRRESDVMKINYHSTLPFKFEYLNHVYVSLAEMARASNRGSASTTGSCFLLSVDFENRAFEGDDATGRTGMAFILGLGPRDRLLIIAGHAADGIATGGYRFVAKLAQGRHQRGAAVHFIAFAGLLPLQLHLDLAKAGARLGWLLRGEEEDDIGRQLAGETGVIEPVSKFVHVWGVSRRTRRRPDDHPTENEQDGSSGLLPGHVSLSLH